MPTLTDCAAVRRVCCGEDRSGAFHPEDDMTRSMISTLALSALVASGISCGAAQAQTTGGPTVTAPAPTATEPAPMAPTPVAAPAPLPRTIAPSVLYGAGPPIDGLDSHPYREREMRNTRTAGNKPPQSASTAGGKTQQPARGGAKSSKASTTTQ
jgi:hypothetical protein